MQGLGLVAARRWRDPLEQLAAIQAHAALRVAHALAADERQQRARDAVGEAAAERHRRRVAEPVADHELRVQRRRRELRDELGRVLPVGVEDDDRVGAFLRAQHRVDSRGNGIALAGVVLDPHDAGRPRPLRDPVELRVQAGGQPSATITSSSTCASVPATTRSRQTESWQGITAARRASAERAGDGAVSGAVRRDAVATVDMLIR